MEKNRLCVVLLILSVVLHENAAGTLKEFYEEIYVRVKNVNEVQEIGKSVARAQNLVKDIDELQNLFDGQRNAVELLEKMQQLQKKFYGMKKGKEPAEKCDPEKCKLPSCFCSGITIPGNLSAKEVPQMVVLTFQNAVQPQNTKLYLKLFEGRKNPNNCSTTATFFVSHVYTDYYQVQTLYSKRHEIGTNTIYDHVSPFWWKNATYKNWMAEIEGSAMILEKYAAVKNASMRGTRAPFLQMGGDEQMNAIKDSLLEYDATRVSVKYMDAPKLMWPYTYDYASTQDCIIGPCPTESHPGVWQIPLIELRDPQGHATPTVDGSTVNSTMDAFNFLHDNFMKHYESNRAPYVLTIGTSWMIIPFKFNATMLFLDFLKSLEDVYVVSASQVIDWIKKPTPLSELGSFEPWKCDKEPPTICKPDETKTCLYDTDRKLVTSGGTPVYSLHSCVQDCSPCYPWSTDPSGTSC